MWVIAKLTFREGIRRRAWVATLLGAIAIGLLILIPLYAGEDVPRGVNLPPREFGVDVATFFGVFIIEFFASIVAVLMAAGTVSGDLDRGVLAVILPKPLHRWQLLLGKWLGIMLFVLVNMVIWSGLLFVLMQSQSARFQSEVWRAFPGMFLYPALYGTLTFLFSSFAPMAAALTFTCTSFMFAWVGDGVIRLFGVILNLEWLQRFTLFSEWAIPHSRIGTLTGWLLRDNFFSRMTQTVGNQHGLGAVPSLKVFDLTYILGYIVAAFLVAVLIFQRRDVQ